MTGCYLATSEDFMSTVTMKPVVPLNLNALSPTFQILSGQLQRRCDQQGSDYRDRGTDKQMGLLRTHSMFFE